ncbi:MAG: signal peptidase I [Armatimonadetes bacterium]|nr:signal peptidase I [Armatimonadota bacterium]
MDSQKLIDHIARTPLSEILIFALILTVYRLASYKFIKDTPREARAFVWRFLGGVGELFDALIYAAIFIFMVIRPYFFQTFQIPSGSMVPTNLVGDFIGLNKLIYRYTEPKRGDIVVFRPPVQACYPDQLDADGTVNVDFVKRLIGLPGDKIEIRQGQVYINDKPLWEPYKQYTQATNPDNTLFRILQGAERDQAPKSNWKLVKYKGEIIPLNYSEFDANAVGRTYSVAAKYQINDETEWPKVRALPAERIPEGYYFFMGDNRNGSFDSRGWGLVPRSSIVGRAEFIWLPFSRIGKIGYVDNGEKPAPGAEMADFLKK